ncbi:MAG: glucose 1-dehydrogenase [Phycisphaeraceae bacterium]|nr:glucose 1-dehydrogenase [Phycisphaeraceae bacterium]
MKAVAVYPRERDIRLIEVAEPRITSPTQVKLRTLEVGVCGTDREICGFHYGTPPEGSEFLVIGHECLGEVVEVGSGVTGFKPGDLAVLTVRRGCGLRECPACGEGRQDFCYTGRFTERGIKQQHGYMTEMVVDEQQNMVPVPRSLREVAVLVEPLTIAEKALIEVWQVQQRLPWSCPTAKDKKPGHCHHALVLGAGPIGLLGAMAFAAAGFSTFVYSREDEGSEKAELVRSFGATYVSAGRTPVEGLVDRIGTIDVVYEATGASRLSFEVLKQVGANAAFIFTGVPGLKGPAEIDTDQIMRNMVLKNQVLLGTVNAGRDAFEAAIRDLGVFMEKWPGAVRKLLTGRFRAQDYREPLLSTDGIKSVITFS